jgi:hypothetical protein
VIRAGPPLLRGNLPPECEQEFDAKEIEPVASVAGSGVGTITSVVAEVTGVRGESIPDLCYLEKVEPSNQFVVLSK